MAKLLEVLFKLRDTGNTLLIIEHNLDVIKTADWIIELGPEGGSGGGKIVAEGPPADLIARSRTTTTISLRLQSPIPPGALAAIQGIGGLECTDALVRFVATNVNEALAQLIPVLDRHGLDIAELHAQRATLEEVVAGFL